MFSRYRVYQPMRVPIPNARGDIMTNNRPNSREIRDPGSSDTDQDNRDKIGALARQFASAKTPLSAVLLMRTAEKLAVSQFEQFARRADVGYSAFDDIFEHAERSSVAAYATDADGFVIRYNEHAIQLWGWSPPLGIRRWGGAWSLLHQDGRIRPMELSPMAVALRERRSVSETTVLGLRPDDSLLAMRPLAFPIRSRGLGMLGGVNLLLDVRERVKIERDHLGN